MGEVGILDNSVHHLLVRPEIAGRTDHLLRAVTAGYDQYLVHMNQDPVINHSNDLAQAWYILRNKDFRSGESMEISSQYREKSAIFGHEEGARAFHLKEVIDMYFLAKDNIRFEIEENFDEQSLEHRFADLVDYHIDPKTVAFYATRVYEVERRLASLNVRRGDNGLVHTLLSALILEEYCADQEAGLNAAINLVTQQLGFDTSQQLSEIQSTGNLIAQYILGHPLRK